MYQITFYVPEAYVEEVKTALFDAGAGALGNYTHCAWQVKGEGQFMPGLGSNAFIGEIHKLEKVVEYRVEMVCHETLLAAAIEALKKAHPYETPAYQIIRLEDD